MVRILPVLLQCRCGVWLGASFPPSNARPDSALLARTTDGAGNSFGETRSWPNPGEHAINVVTANSTAQSRCVIAAPSQYMSLGRNAKSTGWLKLCQEFPGLSEPKQRAADAKMTAIYAVSLGQRQSTVSTNRDRPRQTNRDNQYGEV